MRAREPHVRRPRSPQTEKDAVCNVQPGQAPGWYWWSRQRRRLVLHFETVMTREHSTATHLAAFKVGGEDSDKGIRGGDGRPRHAVSVGTGPRGKMGNRSVRRRRGRGRGGAGDRGVRRRRQRGGGGTWAIEAGGVGGEAGSSGRMGYSKGHPLTWAGPLARVKRMVADVGKQTPSTSCVAQAGERWLTAGRPPPRPAIEVVHRSGIPRGSQRQVSTSERGRPGCATALHDRASAADCAGADRPWRLGKVDREYRALRANRHHNKYSASLVYHTSSRSALQDGDWIWVASSKVVRAAVAQC